MINAGKEEVMFLKNLVASKSDDSDSDNGAKKKKKENEPQ